MDWYLHGVVKQIKYKDMGNLNKIRAIIGKNDILPNLEIARYSSDRVIKLTTTAVAINFQSMDKLYKHLQNEGVNVTEMYISTMPAMNHALCIVIGCE